MALNFFLLALYCDGWPGSVGWNYFRYFPVETMSNRSVLPLLLSMLGLLLLDLSYVIGLLCLCRYRRGKEAAKATRSGWLLTAGVVILLPVLLNTIQLFSGLDYRPFDLEGSGFVTLSEIEGPDFRLTGDSMTNMDYISHGGTVLSPAYWYFQQYGSYSHFDGGVDINEVPHLILSAFRYPMKAMAEKRVREWCNYRYSYSDTAYEALTSIGGLDEGYLLRSGEESYLVLRLGTLVLRADY